MHAAPQADLRPLIIVQAILRRWLVIFLIVYGLFNALPFVAPVLMKAGWAGAGNAVYSGYSFLCHQMAQRSFFLFGEQVMYAPDQLPLNLTSNTGADALLLRNFRGSDALGWKVAWSDRMVSLYTGTWLAAVIYWVASRVRTIGSISVWTFGLLMLPIVLDGGTHAASDNLGGLTTGFRYTNGWLQVLTGDLFPRGFYIGDTVGSFNWWARLVTGLLAAAGIVWFAFPLIDQSVRRTVHDIDRKRERISEAQRRLSTSFEDAYRKTRAPRA